MRSTNYSQAHFGTGSGLYAGKCVGALCYGLMHYYSRLNANGLLDWFGVRPVASLLAIGLLLTLSIGDSIPGIESRIAEML